ncbi:MAG: SPASM domain-containing protein [Candidatus Muiribacteriota bacterium]|jgi:radical SAM protein with 4Fe4S-binding SPASM domain
MTFILKKHGEPIPVLIIDLISYCNLNCVMCPQSAINRNEKYRGVMDFELYKKIIDELAAPPQKARVIIPFWNGEPVLYPHFKQAVIYAGEKKRQNPEAWEVWSLHSNFTLINNEIAEAIIDSELFGPITVSLDACSESVYKKIRVGGDFNNTISNIKEFIKIRNSKKKQFPSLVMQFIVMDENVAETENFVNFWKAEFDKYGIKPKIVWDEAGGFEKDTIFIRRMMADKFEKQQHYDEIHKKVLADMNFINGESTEKTFISSEFDSENTEKNEKRREPCVGLWQHFGIRYDGEVSACCRDFRCEMSIGNINKNSIWELWNSEKLKQFRLYHIAGKFNLVKICKYCPGQPFGQMTKEITESYTDSIDKKSQFKKDIDEIWKS